jgi:hypothetical protein
LTIYHKKSPAKGALNKKNIFYSAETFPFDLAITSSAILFGAGA